MNKKIKNNEFPPSLIKAFNKLGITYLNYKIGITNKLTKNLKEAFKEISDVKKIAIDDIPIYDDNDL